METVIEIISDASWSSFFYMQSPFWRLLGFLYLYIIKWSGTRLCKLCCLNTTVSCLPVLFSWVQLGHVVLLCYFLLLRGVFLLCGFLRCCPVVSKPAQQLLVLESRRFVLREGCFKMLLVCRTYDISKCFPLWYHVITPHTFIWSEVFCSIYYT